MKQIWLVIGLCLLVGVVSGQDILFDVEEYEVLTPENISQIQMVAQLGPGSNAEPVWSNNETLLINTTHGQWRYDVTRLDQPTFVPYLPSDGPRNNLSKIWDLSELDSSSIAISPDGKYEVEVIQPSFSEPISGEDYQVPLIVREKTTGDEVARLMSDALVPRSYGGFLIPPHFGVLGLTYFRFGDLYRWSPNSQQETYLIGSDRLDREHLAFSPDGRYMASFNLSLMEHAPITLRLWDLNVAPASLLLVKDFPDADSGEYPGSLNADFSTDGQTLITSRESQNIRFWDITSRGMIYRDTNPEYWSHAETHQVVYSPDNQFIAGCQISLGGNYAFIRDVATGQYVAFIDGFWGGEGQFCKVFFHPTQSDFMVTTSEGTLAIWPLADLLARKSVMLEDAPLIFGDEQERDEERSITVALNTSGTMIALAYGDGTIHLVDYVTRQEMDVLKNTSLVLSLIFNPKDDNQLITGDDDGNVRVWNRANKTYETLVTFEGPYSRYSQATNPLYRYSSKFPLVMNEEGTLLAALDGKQKTYFWDTRTWDEYVREDVVPEIFSPDGRFIVMFNARDISFWGVPKEK
jgi:WD40 repeat protein